MDKQNNTRNRRTYQVEAAPYDYAAGMVCCEVYHPDHYVDREARLIIKPNGVLEFRTRNDVFPVRAVHFTYSGHARIESEAIDVIDDGKRQDDPYIEISLLMLGVHREAWRAASAFAKSLIPQPTEPRTGLAVELTIWELPHVLMGFGVEVQP